MAGYNAIYNLVATETTLKARAAVAVAKYALYVLGASQDATLLTWARAALRDPVAQVHLMAFAIVADGAIADAEDPGAVSDAALQTIVETRVNSEFKNGVG